MCSARPVDKQVIYQPTDILLLLFQSKIKSTSLPGGGINVFAALFHTHLAGKSVKYNVELL